MIRRCLGGFALWLLFGCGAEKQPLSTPLTYKRTDILIFLKEQVIELRADTAQVLLRLPLFEPMALPLGVFKMDESFLLSADANFPQDLTSQADTALYLQNLLSASDWTVLSSFLQPDTQVYIFPNDALGKRQFQPCLRCSPQTVSLYSTLWLYWRAFNR